jgi:quercetin dioxygenase-like cupin family protein
MTRSLEPKTIEPGAGIEWSVVGDTIRGKLRGCDTGGAFALLEVISPPGGGTPLHVHAREDETFVVLEGEIEFQIAGALVRPRPGTTLFGPRGVPHRYGNVGTTASRMLVLATPAGIEDFFDEVTRDFRTVPPAMPAFAQLCARYGIELLPPR